MSVTPFGADEAIDVAKRLEDGLEEIVMNVVADWIRTDVVPVSKATTTFKDRTGNLRANLRLVSVNRTFGSTVFVVGWGSEAPYGRFLERGTSHIQPPKEFVTNAILAASPTLPRKFADQIQVEIVRYTPLRSEQRQIL